MLRILLLAMMMIALAPGADAAKRVGLVIGNNAYAGLPQDLQLKKAINDAKAMRETLERDLGFQVFYGENADWRGMNALVTQLETAIEAGDVVFFYFAGHGVSVGAENYLLPADVPPLVAGEEARLLGNSFGAEQLTRRLQAKAPRAIFAVLDACRNNPFRTEGGRAAGGPSGLQRIDAAKGVFTLYAAGLGQVALDRLADDDPDPNSVFTRTLIPLLKQGGLSQVDLAKQVQSTVAQLAAKIGHVQEPAYYDQILGFVALKEGAAQLPPGDDGQAALAAAGDNIAMLDVVRQRFTGSVWASMAEAKIRSIEAKQRDVQVALNLPVKPPELPATGCDGAVLVKAGADEKCLTPGDVFRDCDACPEMVVMAAGRFLMGEPDSDLAKRRRIEIAAPFAMSKYEVTFADWDACTSAGPCPVAADNGWGRQTRPVINVSWTDAKRYAGWLSARTGKTYRLPSETEWEYSARASSDANYSFGDDSGRLNDHAWNGWNSGGSTHPVGEKTANAFGLHDMHGNISEFVEDCHNEDASAIPLDGTPHTSGSCDNRVARGGSWNDSEFYARSGERQWFSADLRYDRVGFRIARTLGP
jgi:formylglycine-generating enzyme required for sulfatase activity